MTIGVVSSFLLFSHVDAVLRAQAGSMIFFFQGTGRGRFGMRSLRMCTYNFSHDLSSFLCLHQLGNAMGLSPFAKYRHRKLSRRGAIACLITSVA